MRVADVIEWIPILAFVIALFSMVINYFNYRFQKVKQFKETEKEVRETKKEKTRQICASIDKIMQDGTKYWLSSDKQTRLSLKPILIYELKLLGPSIQNLFDDDFKRKRAVLLVRVLRQNIFKGDFEYPSDHSKSDSKTANRISSDAANLKLYVEGYVCD